MSKLSRRTLITRATALPAFAVPAVAVVPATAAVRAETDPIFAAIERHRQSIVPWKAAVEIESELRHDDPRYADAGRVTQETACDLHVASEELVRIYPTTIDGVAALLKYYAESAAIGDRDYWPHRFWNDDSDEADDLENKPFDLFLARHAAAALERIVRSAA
jgi:hypothetical protein